MSVFFQRQTSGLPVLAKLSASLEKTTTLLKHVENLLSQPSSSKTLSFISAIGTGLNPKLQQLLPPKICSEF